MTRASEAADGAIVNAIAYQDEYNTARGRARALRKAAEVKKCPHRARKSCRASHRIEPPTVPQTSGGASQGNPAVAPANGWPKTSRSGSGHTRTRTLPACPNQWFNCVSRGRWNLLSAGQCWGRWLPERQPAVPSVGVRYFIARTRLSASTLASARFGTPNHGFAFIEKEKGGRWAVQVRTSGYGEAYHPQP
jgi:hypothetical protein